jgi:predicted transcriptional regulator
MAYTPQSKRLQSRLQAYRKEYARVTARLQKVGFIFKGSITQRRLPCGNPKCRCRDPKHRHGPYYQVSWKQHGKTASRILPAKIVPLYREWIANARAITAIMQQMQEISRKAADSIQAAEITRGKARNSR